MSGTTIPNTLPHAKQKSLAAFTLIELSIVLVIIGLVAGGILVGISMIKSAEVRSYLGKTNEYRAAFKAFELKYGGMPGDIPNTKAVSMGLPVRATTAPWTYGQGDGDGIIVAAAASGEPFGGTGEIRLLWSDLSASGLIQGTYSGTNSHQGNDADLSLIFPRSAFGKSWDVFFGDRLIGKNYFTQVSGDIVSTAGYGNFSPRATATRAITPLQAYDIDIKIDDGQALTGSVTARSVVSYAAPALATPAAPASGVCVSNATNNYNIGRYEGVLSCMVQIPYE